MTDPNKLSLLANQLVIMEVLHALLGVSPQTRQKLNIQIESTEEELRLAFMEPAPEPQITPDDPVLRDIDCTLCGKRIMPLSAKAELGGTRMHHYVEGVAEWRWYHNGCMWNAIELAQKDSGQASSYGEDDGSPAPPPSIH